MILQLTPAIPLASQRLSLICSSSNGPAFAGMMFKKEAGANASFAEAKDASKPDKPRTEVMNASRWIAPVVTDADGKATITIPLPDSTTQWRLTARGCSRDTLVGQATASLITRKDFFIELKTPIQLQEGDTMRFLAKLHNLTAFEGKVDVTLQLDEAEPQTITVNVKKNSVSDCLFKELTIPLAKSVKLTAKARSGEASDTLVVDLPVRPWGMEYLVSAGGVSTGNANATLKLPGGMNTVGVSWKFHSARRSNKPWCN